MNYTKVYISIGLFAVLSCFCAIAHGADGWASENGGTTGGAGGTVVTVDNATDLIYYTEKTKQAPYIIYVSGHIDLGGLNIRVRGNKSVIGLPGSRITGNLKCYTSIESNNIFRYLDMDNKNKVGDGDCITIDGVTNIWIDHCTFTDAGDGAVDIKNGADYVTVSWCKFQYPSSTEHTFCNLIGHSDDNADKDMGRLRVTFHHNWYSTLCHERMPSVRFGKAHIYNTYFDCPGNRYCIRTRLYAQCLVENNYFKDVQNPWERYTTTVGDDPGLLYASGNILDNVTWYIGDDSQSSLIDGTDTVFTPPYAYTPDDAARVPAIVQWGAGADGRDGYPPHWMFGTYGDFDYSGLVDMKDFATFAGYWLAASGIADADYTADGIVDSSELELFAANWMQLPEDVTAPAAPAGLSALAGDGSITLDWADNGEQDLDGYNIYRSTTHGTGYAKLNSSPLSASNYSDNAVTNGTAYYYAVTAIDTSGNESAFSTEVSGIPMESGTLIIQETAAGYCGIDGIVDTSGEHAGYTGIGYLDTTNAIGSGINWSVNAGAGGSYMLLWRFANGSTSARPASVLVNGIQAIASVNFPTTGAWANWTTVSAEVTLPAGVSSIRLEATTSGGCANIDYFQMSGASPEAAACQ
ncbi:MAG: carbohydrate-binding protein [Planctomycetaceae bacterium]|nr:carbohydrate-binding protein [Planctomycetaceae bacterium]